MAVVHQRLERDSPPVGQVFLDYHQGAEDLVVLDGDHVFDVLAERSEVIDEALAYSLAWLQGNWQVRA